MLLEGESKKCSITLHNSSSTTPVDFLLLSFVDSTRAQLQEALASKELSASELYELELNSARKPPFQWLRAENGDEQIKPGANLSLEIQILGKTGLTDGVIHVDYGFIGVPRTEVKEGFYTCRTSLPVTVTVCSSIDLVDSQILPLIEAFGQEMQSSPLAAHEGPDDDDGDKQVISKQMQIESHLDTPMTRFKIADSSSPRCLLILDFRNSWSSTLTLTLRILPSSSLTDQKAFDFDHIIHPYTSTRIPIPLPRMYLPSSAAHAPIPSLNKATKRQFVVSATKSSPEAERIARETFWYREEIFKRISALWKEESTGRSGTVELRTMSLTSPMIQTYKLDDIAISMSVEPNSSSTPKKNPTPQKVTQLTNHKFLVKTSTFLTLLTTLHNRSPSPIRPLLRLQPTLAHQPSNIALDLSKKLLVNGVLQRPLPTLKAGETIEVKTG
ncbi:MAG: hypothetical protein Q9164_007681, partial [Protoblastenia rupestris]